MTLRTAIMKIVQQDRLNFLLTNRIPRRHLTTWLGWFSRIENPVLCAASLKLWGMFTQLDLHDAQDSWFRSLHHCFTRRLRPGARPADPRPAILASPCDGIVGQCGAIEGTGLLQIKGMPYSLQDLFGDDADVAAFQDGQYVTLRLTSAMYHRFHAPHDCHVDSVTHIFGDTWNVNPATLRRISRLFCKNERALIRATLPGSGHRVMLVAVAAILVAGIRLEFLDLTPANRRLARTSYPCDTRLAKGAPMGWFEHGSTIIVFAPKDFTLADGIREGATIQAGRALMRLPAA